MTEAAGQERGRRVLQLVGLARRAGHVVVGTRAVKDSAARGGVHLVVISRDATENAVKRLRGLLEEPGLEVISFGTRAGLGRAVGRQEAVVVGICDRGLGRRIAGEANRNGVQAKPLTSDELDGTADLE